MNRTKSSREYIKELGEKIKYYRIMKEMSQQEYIPIRAGGICAVKQSLYNSDCFGFGR